MLLTNWHVTPAETRDEAVEQQRVEVRIVGAGEADDVGVGGVGGLPVADHEVGRRALDGADAHALRQLDDGRVLGLGRRGDDDLRARVAQAGEDALEHRPPGDVGHRLPRQTAGRHPGGHADDRLHADFFRRSGVGSGSGWAGAGSSRSEATSASRSASSAQPFPASRGELREVVGRTNRRPPRSSSAGWRPRGSRRGRGRPPVGPPR